MSKPKPDSADDRAKVLEAFGEAVGEPSASPSSVRDKVENLATAVEVWDDIRRLTDIGIELRDQLGVLIRREGPALLELFAKHLGKTSEDIVQAVLDARAENKIDMDRYRLKHSPVVKREMKERYNINVDDEDPGHGRV